MISMRPDTGVSQAQFSATSSPAGWVPHGESGGATGYERPHSGTMPFDDTHPGARRRSRAVTRQ